MRFAGFEDVAFVGWTGFYTSPTTRGATFTARKPGGGVGLRWAAVAVAVAAALVAVARR